MGAPRFAVGIALLALLGGLLGISHMRHANARKHTSRAAGDARRSAEAATRTEVLPLVQHFLPAASPPPSPSSSAISPEPAPEAAEGNEELALVYANEYESEAVDRSWSIDAERAISREVQTHLPPGSAVVSLACRSRFCRLEAIHDTIERSNELLMDLFFLDHNGPFSKTDQGFRQGEPSTTPDGKVRSVVYISRPGVSVALTDG